MGRETRIVPPDWEHPTNEAGDHIPLHAGYSRAVEERTQWARGFKRDYKTDRFVPRGPDDNYSVEDYFGSETVDPADYMPEWSPGVASHYMMYENTSEGTPISPAFATPEELARWLADTGASSFADMTATYEQWLHMIKRGSAPSALVVNGKMTSGVAGCSSPSESGGTDQ